MIMESSNQHGTINLENTKYKEAENLPTQRIIKNSNIKMPQGFHMKSIYDELELVTRITTSSNCPQG
jgi:hypothetical protein